MKYLIILSLFVSSFCFSQESNSKSQKVSFNVKGVCEMCKDRIEKGTIKLKGVKYAVSYTHLTLPTTPYV